MSKIVITLEDADMVELQNILIDRDPEDALKFIEQRIAPKLPCAGASMCDPNRQNPFVLKRDH